MKTPKASGALRQASEHMPTYAYSTCTVMKCCPTTLKSDRFLAIFMEHRLNTQHSQLMYSLL